MDQNQKMPDVNNSHKTPSKTTLISEQKWSRRRIVKNLLCSSCGIFLLFTGYEGVAHLQSTMNSQEGMGLASQAVIYALFCLSSLFLPKITIRKLGCKLTMTLSLLAYCPYIASNFYPEWSTLIPSAALLGLSASLLWASTCTYLNKLSAIYKKNVGGQSTESVTALFFGVSSAFYLSSHLSGNSISFFVLGRKNSSLVISNGTHCGIKFLEDDIVTGNNANLDQPSKNLRNILIGILLGSSVVAVLLVALFLDPLHYAEDEVFSRSGRLTATFRMMLRKNQVLLMPLALYYGMQEGFYTGDFTKVYIACSWGVYHIGLVTMCLGLSSAICSTASGRLQKYTGRISIFAVAALANIFTFVQFFIWIPDPSKPYLFFVCASMWGIFNGIYVAQVRAFYGQLFRDEEESAFANFYLWTSIGHCLSFSYSEYLSITTKLYLLIIVFCLSQIGYAVVEYGVRDSIKNENVLSQKGQTNGHKY